MTQMLVFTTAADNPALETDRFRALFPDAHAPHVLVPGRAIEIAGATEEDLAHGRESLAGEPVDVNLMPATNRRKQLLVADMDMTMIPVETIDEFAAEAGISEQVAEITRRAMNGEIEFKAALRERLALLKGKPKSIVDKVLEKTVLRPGARTLVRTMAAHGARTVLVSGGFTQFTQRVADLAGFDMHRANTLEFDGDAFAGTAVEPIFDANMKLATMGEECAELGLAYADAAAIGDGANDLPMLEAAGLGVAFKAKPAVAERTGIHLDHSDLDAMLALQGYAEKDHATD
ncbi:MAG: phosphoserine phosphatase SerB [Alphaproteobacteria bacterium]|nr:phosphoserine phosphatase SerB [Alphaproteobacteria bacterium]